MKHTGTCRPFCSGTDCIVANQDKVDFTTAEERCRDSNGELMTFQSATDERFLDTLSRELDGSFWIGLRLPADACSNLSAPLRGYEWTSGRVHRDFIPSLIPWKHSVTVCSPHCVSLSKDHKWTEQLCSDQTDGFLCKTSHKDACQAQELSDPHVFQSPKGCSDGPCEQKCTEVTGGFKCSCFSGYAPDSKDPRRCKVYCAQEKCPAICDRNTDSACFCPDGFIINDDKVCQDINECVMQQCDQLCENSFGSFVCSCKEGFVLKNEVKCIRAEDSIIPTPMVKPAASNNTLKASSLSSGGFILIWVFLAVSVVVLICVVRFYVVKRQKHGVQTSNQRSTASVDNVASYIQSNEPINL